MSMPFTPGTIVIAYEIPFVIGEGQQALVDYDRLCFLMNAAMDDTRFKVLRDDYVFADNKIIHHVIAIRRDQSDPNDRIRKQE